MKKIIFCIVTMGIATSAIAALSDLEQATCYINSCPTILTADSSCDSICSWCSGSATTPTGYVYKAAFVDSSYETSFGRNISLLCGDSTYSCVCGVAGAMAITGSLLCDTGYYGVPSYTYTERYGDSFSGCNRCPSLGGVYGTTAGPGATSITECYMPSGNTFSDDTGSGVYDGDCYYIN